MTDQQKVKVLSQQTNAAVVQMPGRRFPDLVIQGDSFAILESGARALLSRIEGIDAGGELRAEALELVELLQGYLAHYEQVLEQHQIDLPYATARRDGDGS